jgi:hypothetical protein
MSGPAALLVIKGDYHAGGVTVDAGSYRLTGGTIRLYGDFYDYSYLPFLLPYYRFMAEPESGFTVDFCGDGLLSIFDAGQAGGHEQRGYFLHRRKRHRD